MGETETADLWEAEILRTKSELFRRPDSNFLFIKESRGKMLSAIACFV